MKYAALSNLTSINIGDEIQSLAAMQFLPHVDYYVDRESLDRQLTDEKIKLILNGWFMINPQNWPPAKNIVPLLVSMHLTNRYNTSQILLSGQNLQYFKKHEPVGCRDMHTLHLMQKQKIKAYFSGCLTLTFPHSNEKRNDEILCVDAFVKLNDYWKNKCFDILLPESIKNRVHRIEHDHCQNFKSLEEKFDYAKNLLDRYRRAKLVITSRIHCALPCLAFGTPVYFVDIGYSNKSKRNRFGGIVDMLNTLDASFFPITGYKKLDLISRFIPILPALKSRKELKINWDNPPENSVNIEPYREKLREIINQFI